MSNLNALWSIILNKNQWLYQVRIRVDENLSNALRAEDKTGTSGIIFSIANTHKLTPVCTYDAFRDYCLEAEQNTLDNYPLYEWTKQTIENPQKAQKHKKSFAFFLDSEQVYEEELARSLFKDLKPLYENNLISEVKLIDSNPANNPQPPKNNKV